MKYRNFTNKLMLMVGVTATAVLTSCEQEFYQDEQYRKEIYIVSGEDNIFQREFAFGGEERRIILLLSIWRGKMLV